MDLTVSVIGTGRSAPETDTAAEQVGAGLARAGAVVVCGGLGGVMAAACRGARLAGGRTVGILPGVDPAAANPWVDIALPTGLGEARNVLVVRAGRAVIAVGGGFGTLSELAFAHKLEVPVIGIGTFELDDDPTVHAASPAEAVRLALKAAAGGT